MSIYSGFATRQQQQTYDHCINSLLFILQKRILKFYNNQKTDEYKFATLVQKMFLQLRHMEKSKYLDPKCSYAMQQLFQYLLKENYSQNATVQQNSINQDSLRNQVIRKKPAEQKSFKSSNPNSTHYQQKVYQIPIRSEKTPNRNISSDPNNLSKKIGKIVSSSKSKQKSQLTTIQNSKHLIRQRTPSTSNGTRIQKKIIPLKQENLHMQHSRQKNIASLHNSRQKDSYFPHSRQKNQSFHRKNYELNEETYYGKDQNNSARMKQNRIFNHEQIVQHQQKPHQYNIRQFDAYYETQNLRRERSLNENEMFQNRKGKNSGRVQKLDKIDRDKNQQLPEKQQQMKKMVESYLQRNQDISHKDAGGTSKLNLTNLSNFSSVSRQKNFRISD